MQRIGWILRSALFFLWLVVTVVPWATFVVLMSIFVRGTRLYWVCVGWLAASIWGARVICGVRHRVHGLENVPTAADGRAAVLLAPKHQSTWETFAFPVLMPHPLCYVFKRELLWIPFFGWAIGSLDMIHIDRSRRNEAWSKVAEQGRRYMAQGNWVIMFPEGTRIPRGQQCTYKTGASRLAITPEPLSCRSPSPRRAAGRARASCCALAWWRSPLASRSTAPGASPKN